MSLGTGGPRGAAWVQNAAPDESDDSVPLPLPGVNWALRRTGGGWYNVRESVPVLGGIISVDVQDARDFFGTLPEQS